MATRPATCLVGTGFRHLISISYSSRGGGGAKQPQDSPTTYDSGAQIVGSVLWKEVGGKRSPHHITRNTCALEGIEIFALGTNRVTQETLLRLSGAQL